MYVSTVDGAKISNVESLVLRQNGGPTLSMIVDGISNDSTWVVKEGSSCIIRTVVDSDFFKPSFRGSKRTNLVAEGSVGLKGDTADADFRIEVPLRASRLTSYMTRHGLVIAIFIIVLLVIGVWAFCVYRQNLSRGRLESLSASVDLRASEEERFVAIFTIWQQSKSLDMPILTYDTWSSSSSEDEKEAIDQTET